MTAEERTIEWVKLIISFNEKGGTPEDYVGECAEAVCKAIRSAEHAARAKALEEVLGLVACEIADTLEDCCEECCCRYDVRRIRALIPSQGEE